jgi:exodeoxyribonuclease-3
MRIATYNANSIRARLPIILQWLQKYQPDVLCVQETKVQDAEFPALDFEQLGYTPIFSGQKSYNGVAILSKKKPSEVGTGLDSQPKDESRLIYAKIDNVYIVNTYIPQGRELDHEMFQYKLKWFARLKRFFKKHFSPDDMVVWLGDINVARGYDDIHNAKKQEQHVCFHQSARKAFENTMKWGFVDVFREKHPEPGHYTFFDYRTVNVVKRKMGWRIDMILCSEPLAALCTDSFIDLEPRLQERPSDHTFLVADFDVPA